MIRTYGSEFFILPLLGVPYFYAIGEFTLPGALFNNAVLTAVFAGLSLWRSKVIARAIGNREHHRLEPVWPAFAGLLLVYLAAVQLILSIAHISYYRRGQLITDMFDV